MLELLFSLLLPFPLLPFPFPLLPPLLPFPLLPPLLPPPFPPFPPPLPPPFPPPLPPLPAKALVATTPSTERLKGATTSTNATSARKTSLQPLRDARIPLSQRQPFSPSAELPRWQCRSISIPNQPMIRKWPTTLVLSTRTYCYSR
ncbi:hypothetical protein EN828_23365 [Mesorhizobium sp. M2D.F.Ca.ET.185.01.1.1]|nr:hypothetical protein EN783_24595 [Mesorhizobium sp. M2D.F.Ca.ET.140.01.1.1]TGP15098.1 hypothetical protein EN876_22540 [Mesorhizobium sp. M2D.F.Ca.ET.233.01.1.1]TGP29560.1 hypothetical protein EN875_027015 [Mesorhizobium sp. M2D.F.Ca.ET.232.01.1.1]TGP56313.1 hypothetical protein EN869_022655 [Mesorhizobium sp. M2D.F.Ca.ET.226.01.1.1]TGP65858.1 hypothetical protein EN868_23785 [Mesorhizobium sp. M2D.F.Ca.ET.225.01.1.1]TGP71284.1 hypothetical protein EN867_26810 [Mesorhizobium sp. M2D.F.Ca.ET